MPREHTTGPTAEQVLDMLVEEIARLNPEAGQEEGRVDPDAALLDAGYVDSLTAA